MFHLQQITVLDVEPREAAFLVLARYRILQVHDKGLELKVSEGSSEASIVLYNLKVGDIHILHIFHEFHCTNKD